MMDWKIWSLGMVLIVAVTILIEDAIVAEGDMVRMSMPKEAWLKLHTEKKLPILESGSLFQGQEDAR